MRPLVERALMHDDEHVRRLAVHALNDLGVASSVTVLRTLRDRETSAEVIEIIDLALAKKLPTTGEMTR